MVVWPMIVNHHHDGASHSVIAGQKGNRLSNSVEFGERPDGPTSDSHLPSDEFHQRHNSWEVSGT